LGPRNEAPVQTEWKSFSATAWTAGKSI